MWQYVIRRLIQIVPTLFLASVLIFLIIVLAPGDPASMSLGIEATRAEIEAERIRLGLDRPLVIRYFIWLGDVATLNLGQSMIQNRPVATLLKEAIPHTIRLTLASLMVSLPLGIGLGIVSALRQDTWVDGLITGLNAFGLSVPSFWLGILLILLFAVKLRWLPPSGVGDPSKDWPYNLRYLIMPVISLSFARWAVFCRFTRSCLLDVMSADYIRTARSKGLQERIVVLRHAIRNTLIPMLTIVGIQIGRLLGGAVVTESIFAYSGMGRLVMTGIRNRDYTVVQGGLIVVVFIFLVTNLLIDLLYGYIDPRVAHERNVT